MSSHPEDQPFDEGNAPKKESIDKGHQEDALYAYWDAIEVTTGSCVSDDTPTTADASTATPSCDKDHSITCKPQQVSVDGNDNETTKSTWFTKKRIALLLVALVVVTGIVVGTVVGIKKKNTCKVGEEVDDLNGHQLELSLVGVSRPLTPEEQRRIEITVLEAYNQVSEGCDDVYERWMYKARMADQSLVATDDDGGSSVLTVIDTSVSCKDCPEAEAFASVYPSRRGLSMWDVGSRVRGGSDVGPHSVSHKARSLEESSIDYIAIVDTLENLLLAASSAGLIDADLEKLVDVTLLSDDGQQQIAFVAESTMTTNSGKGGKGTKKGACGSKSSKASKNSKSKGSSKSSGSSKSGKRSKSGFSASPTDTPTSAPSCSLEPSEQPSKSPRPSASPKPSVSAQPSTTPSLSSQPSISAGPTLSASPSSIPSNTPSTSTSPSTDPSPTPSMMPSPNQ